MGEKNQHKTWMIRAGQGGFLINEFFNKGIVALGWNELSKVSEKTNYEELKALVRGAYPDYSKGRISQSSGQLWRFFDEVSIGDRVVTYDPDGRWYYYGEVKSDYRYSKSNTYRHYRRVDWDDGAIERDDLVPESKNVLGSILTLFEIPDHVYEDLKKAHPSYLSEEDLADMEESLRMYEEYEKEQEDRIRDEVIAKSTEFIKDLIAELDSEQLEVLVAGLLTSMGYKSRLTPKVRDLGSDIHASPDGLGMLEPRIKAEVKHKNKSKAKASAPELRNFIGGLRTIEKGIYVSTTGFSQDAKYEAERANFPITLVDFDLLVELLLENYGDLEPEVKALVPLRKIYWPV